MRLNIEVNNFRGETQKKIILVNFKKVNKKVAKHVLVGMENELH